MKFLKIIILNILFTVPFLNAQNDTLKGFVYDIKSGLPLSGANIKVVGTSTGTITAEDGEFFIGSLKSGLLKLEISHLGYETLPKK